MTKSHPPTDRPTAFWSDSILPLNTTDSIDSSYFKSHFGSKLLLFSYTFL